MSLDTLPVPFRPAPFSVNRPDRPKSYWSDRLSDGFDPRATGLECTRRGPPASEQ